MNIVEELRNKKSRDNRELLDRAADRIEELERKQSEGEWIYEYSGDCLNGTDASLDYKCSLCGGLSTDPFGYCQHCGAKMKGEKL